LDIKKQHCLIYFKSKIPRKHAALNKKIMTHSKLLGSPCVPLFKNSQTNILEDGTQHFGIWNVIFFDAHNSFLSQHSRLVSYDSQAREPRQSSRVPAPDQSFSCTKATAGEESAHHIHGPLNGKKLFGGSPDFTPPFKL
jgi:hypothetical protein